MSKVKNILIVRTDRIGDLVLTIPMAAKIKEFYPGARITFLIRDYTAPLLEKHPDIDEILILKEKNGKADLKENLNEIRKGNYDTCFLVYPTFKIALIIFLSGIPVRIATAYRWYSFLFNKKIKEHRKSGDRHELEYNLNMLEKINIRTTDNYKPVAFNIQVDEKALKKVKDFLSDKMGPEEKKIIIVHPGSGGSAVDLPLIRMKELVEKLAQSLSYQIILTGSSQEFDICREVAGKSKVIISAGEFNLGELTALISQADVLIANSTGPIHIAAAFGKKIIGFYPRIKSCAKERWGPYTDSAAVFNPEINCTDCTRQQCEKLDCMNSINIEKVIETVRRFLK